MERSATWWWCRFSNIHKFCKETCWMAGWKNLRMFFFEIMPKYPLGNSSNVYVPPTVTAASSHSKVTFLHHSSNNQRHSRLLVYHVNSHFVNSFFFASPAIVALVVHNSQPKKNFFFRCSDSTKCIMHCGMSQDYVSPLGEFSR